MYIYIYPVQSDLAADPLERNEADSSQACICVYMYRYVYM